MNEPSQETIVIEPEPAMPERGRRTPWGFPDVIVVSALVLSATLLASYADVRLSGVTEIRSGSFHIKIVLRSIYYQNIFLIAVTALWVSFKARPALRRLGLSTEQWESRFLLGVGFGIVLFVMGEMIANQFVFVLKQMGLTHADLTKLSSHASRNEVERLLHQPRMIALASIGIAIVAPVGEEVFFRGFMYQGLKSHMPTWAAAALSSAVFGLVHISPVEFFALFALGLALTWLFERTGNLTAPIVAHAMNNAISTALFILAPKLASL